MDTSIEKLCLCFKPGEMGNRIIFFRKIESTNTKALALSKEEVSHGTVIVAGTQTAGRGRQGRQWFSLEDVGLFFTLIVLPDEHVKKIIPLLSIVAALAVYESLEEFGCPDLDIKWPNDVLVQGRKISGILGEMKTGTHGIERVALGMSVNVSHSEADFSPDLRSTATSIFASTGVKPELEDVLLSLLEKHNKWFGFLEKNGSAALIKEAEQRSSWAKGREISFTSGSGAIVNGTTLGFSPDGSLKVKTESGEELSLHAGDVHLKK